MTRRQHTEVPTRIVGKLRAMCLRLPEAYQERAWVGTRWMIRKRNFAHVVAIDDGWPPAYARAARSDGPLVVLTFRTSDFLHEALRAQGAPFFSAEWGTRWGTKVIGMALDEGVDWEQVAMLVTESYCLLAPAKLAAEVPAARRARARSAAGPTPRPRSV
jgi:hypothetical protein